MVATADASITAGCRPGTISRNPWTPDQAVMRILLMILLIVPSVAYAAAQVSVADLAWMTGTWVGPLGEQTLEEHWVEPSNGTIACVVRFTSNGATNIYELIVIAEEADTLVFRVRQWHPGFVPFDSQTMTLADIGNRRVSFKAVGPGNFATLSYARPANDEFHIAVQTQDGGAFQLVLRRKR